MKLIEMTDFTLEQEKKFNQWEKTFDSSTSFWKCIKYANFLKQPLKLEMFVPVDEEGNVLEEPLQEHYTDCTEEQNAKDWLYNLEKYEQAKNKVLFEGIDLDTAKYHCERNVRTIEYFTSFNVELTPNAIKQLGL
jgi:hypothetical protein